MNYLRALAYANGIYAGLGVPLAGGLAFRAGRPNMAVAVVAIALVFAIVGAKFVVWS